VKDIPVFARKVRNLTPDVVKRVRVSLTLQTVVGNGCKAGGKKQGGAGI
jgi:hypothetical protein